MKLRLLALGVLLPTTILFAASARADFLGLPLQLGQFLTGAKPKPKPAEAQPAEETKTQAAPRRRAARHHRVRHVASRHAAPTAASVKLRRPAAEAPSVAAAAPAQAPAPPPAPTALAAASTVPFAAAAGPLAAVSAAPPAADDAAPQFAGGVRVVSAEEFNEIDARADEVKVAAANDLNDIDLSAGAPARTDGRNLDSAAPAERPSSDFITWPRLLAFGVGGPLLIGLLAWPLMPRRRALKPR